MVKAIYTEVAVRHKDFYAKSEGILFASKVPTSLKCLGFSLKAHSLNFPPKSIIPSHSLAIIRAIGATNGTK